MGKNTTLEGMDLVRRTAQLIFDKKVEDVVVLDLQGISTLTDYYLICTCRSEAQMRSAVSSTQKALSKEGIKAIRSDYATGVRWAILDFGELIIHFFEKGTRDFYSLERLWADAKVIPLKAEDHQLAAPEEKDSDEEYGL